MLRSSRCGAGGECAALLSLVFAGASAAAETPLPLRPAADGGRAVHARDEAAAIRLPAVIGDHMVVQQGRPFPVWGWCGADETVTASFRGQTLTTRADAAGAWRVTFDPSQAGGPFTLTLAASGASSRTVHDILVGEVWLGSGQSNMALGLSEKEVRDGAAEIAAAAFPNLRLFTAEGPPAPQAVIDLKGRWLPCSPASVKGFSAAAYFFGRELHRELETPVGLIVSAWPGSPAESWVSREALAAEPELRLFAERFERAVRTYPERQALHAEALRAFERQRTAVEPYTRDAAGWERPELDDSDWEAQELPGAWEGAGLYLDGTVWYRRTVAVPEAWAGRPLELALGPIQDEDVIWFNGVQIGASPPPVRFPLWPQPRRAAVPPEGVRAGRAVIAVRVTNHGGEGGFTGLPQELYLKPVGAPDVEAVALAGPWRRRIAVFRHQRPAAPLAPDSPWLPTALFNGRVAPLTRTPIRGVLWYQGEANAWRAEQYRTLFLALITDWRARWQDERMPFLFVQLPNLRDPAAAPAESDWAELREAQASALRLPATGMAVTIDIGEAGNIHPPNKQEVGRRLALQALATVYGRTLVHSGPVFRKAVFDGPVARVTFDACGGGLVARGGLLKGFALAGADRRFAWAEARIERDAVILTSGEVAAPVAVRYAWADNPADANLCNAEGLPAAPFRTDDWPGITAGRRE